MPGGGAMPASISRLAIRILAGLLASVLGLGIDGSGLGVEPAFAGALRPAPAELSIRASSRVTIDSIGEVKRGRESVLVLVRTGQSGVICKLKLKYNDGNADSPDDVISDGNGICRITFDVPDRRSAVGDATAKVTVVKTNNKSVGKNSIPFRVR